MGRDAGAGLMTTVSTGMPARAASAPLVRELDQILSAVVQAFAGARGSARLLRSLGVIAMAAVFLLTLAPPKALAYPTTCNHMNAALSGTYTNGVEKTGASVFAGDSISFSYTLQPGASLHLYADSEDIATVSNATGSPVTGSSSYTFSVAQGDNVFVDAVGSSTLTVSASCDSIPSTPTVTGVGPGSGSTSGGTTVTITGSNFATSGNGVSVSFGGVFGSGVQVSNSGVLSVVTPSHAAGQVDVVVNNIGPPTQSSTVNASSKFTFVAPAATTTSLTSSVNPTVSGGSTTFTATVTTGSGTPTGTVAFKDGGTNIPGCSSQTLNVGSAQATCTTSGLSVGNHTITAVYSGSSSYAGSTSTNLTQAVNSPVPTVTGVSPAYSSTAGGSTVTVTGTNLTGATAVRFGSTAGSIVSVNSSTSISVSVPAHAAGTVDVTVVTPAGTSATSSADSFAYADAPTITSISPSAGPSAGGDQLTITGTGFYGVTSVTFAGSAGSNLIVNSPTSLTVTTPASSTGGSVNVVVNIFATGGNTDGSAIYKFRAPPTINGLVTTSGSTTGGTSVGISGRDLNPASSVTFGGVPATSFVVNNSLSITAVAPAHVAGTVDVVVTTPGGTTSTSSADQFTYAAPAPTVTSVSPSSGSTAGGGSVTLTGTNLTGATAVSFGGTSATGFTVVNDTTVTATAPAGAAGTVDVTVTTSGGTSGAGAGDHYTYVAPLTLAPSSPLTAATVGASYSNTISASGGTGPYTFAVTSGALPAGLTLASGGGLSGTPTAGGTFNFTITATDGGSSAVGNQAYALTVNAPTITVGPNFPPNMQVATPYGQQFAASGGTGPYTFAVTSGSIPAGMTLSSDGLLSGTATQGGTFNFTITATDSSAGTGPYSGSHAYTLLAQAASVSTSPTTLPDGAVASAYSQKVSGTGGTAPYAFQITGGALPAGLSLNGTTGVVSGTPTASGAFTVFIVATDSSTGTGPFFGGRSYSFNIAAPTIVVAPASLPNGTAGLDYSQTVSGSGGTSPYSFAVTAGALPTGLSLASNGAVTGIPTEVGTFNFTITATDATTGAGPYTASRAYSVIIASPSIVVNPPGLTVATDGVPYSRTFVATAGTAPYAFRISSGALPAGLSLASDGSLSGTPTAVGNFNFSVTVRDSTTGVGAPFEGSRAYTLQVGEPPLTLSPSTLGAATVGASYSATLTTAGGTAPYSYSVIHGALPAGLSLSTSGALTGTPTAGGTFNFTIASVESSTGAGAPFAVDQPYTLTVQSPTVSVGPSNLTAATVGTSYSQTMSASGGTSAYSFAVTSGALPAGLSLTSDGTLTGTPTASGNFNFTITATDSSTGTGPYSGGRGYRLSVNGPTITLSPTSLSGLTQSASTNQTITASGGTGPYSFAVTGGTLPAGLSLSSAGALTGTPTGSGAYSFTVTATDSTTGTGAPFSGSQLYAGTIGQAPPVVSSFTATGTATYNTGGAPTFTIDLSAHATNSPTTYTISPIPGVTKGGAPSSSPTGVISYTPAVGFRGSDQFRFTAGNAAGTSSSSATVTVNVGNPTLTITRNGSGTVGQSLTGVSVTTSGGQAPYSYVLASGSLPAGVTLNSNGTLSGTPTAGGTFTFTVTATDSSTGTGAFSQASGSLSLVINAPTIVISPSSLAAMTQGVATNQSLSGSGGVSTYSFRVTGGTLPNGLSLSSGGALTGTPTNSGAYSFTVTATDSSTGTGPFTGSQAYSGTIAPGIPVAGPKSVSTAYGTAVDIDLSGVITSVTPTGVNVASSPGHGTASVTGTTTIRYTPSGYAGIDTFTYTATGPGGTSSAATVTVTIAPPSIDVTPRALPSATVGTAYSASMTASGGQTPYSYAVTSGALPAGLTLSSAGVVSGTPTAGGDFTFTVTATDSTTGAGSPFSASKSVSLTVRTPTVAIAPATLTNGTQNVGYSQSVSASGGTAPYSFAVTSGALPAGLTLSSGGALSGTPTAAGSFSFTVTATDSSTGTGPYTAAKAYSLTIAGPPTITVNPASLNAATAGKLFSQMLTSTGGTGPYHYAVTAGALPTGTSLTTSGQITGTPTASGTFNFTVTSTDSAGAPGPYSGSHAYAWVVASPSITVSPSSPAGGTVGVTYSQTFTASGGQAPYAYALTSGTLPAGLTLSATGQLNGKPTQAGSFPLTITATDHSAGAFTGTDSFTLVIAAPTVTIGTPTLPNATVQTAYSQTLTASGGTGPYAWVVTVGTLPDGLTLSTGGVLSGTPTTVGPSNFTITATDSSTGTGAPFSASQAYSFTVAPKPVTVTTASVPSGKVGVAYSQTIAAAGGVGPYAFDISAGALPPGLSIAPDGTLSGAPTAAGSYSFTVRATDSLSGTGTKAFSVSVAAPTLVITGRSGLPQAYSGVFYSTTLSGGGGTAPYSFALASGSILPDGMTLSASGVLSGTPTKPASFNFSVVVTDSSGAPGPYNVTRGLAITVVAAPVPTAAAASSSTHVNTPVNIDLTSSVVAANTVAVSTAAGHGSTSVSGLVVIYTPASGFSGTDTFSYTATGPAGTSAPAVVTVTVSGSGPASVSSTQVNLVTAANFTATTPALTPVTVDVTAGGTGGPFTGATVVSVSPSTSGAAVAAATGVSGHYAITFTPNTQFSGTSVVTFTLTSAGGTSAPATLTVTVQPRPDPSLDPDVKGMIGGQGNAARQFAQAQISNFDRRLEQLHGGRGGEGGYASKSSMGLGLDFGDYGIDQRMVDSPAARMRQEEMFNLAGREFDDRRSMAHASADKLMASPSGEGRQTWSGGLSVWVAGNISLGQRHLSPTQSGLKFETQGVSLGVDAPVGEHAVLGFGGGWGHTVDKIGTQGTRSTADNWVGALYGSWNPASNLYIDGVVGRGSLRYDSRRHTSGAFVTGERDGTQTFGSITAAWEHKGDRLNLSPYARLDMADATLDGFTETGDPIWALVFGQEKVRLMTGTLGAHGDYSFDNARGPITPRWRVEYRHDFNNAESSTVRYADLVSGTRFSFSPELEARDNLVLGAGVEWKLNNGWSVSTDWEGQVANQNNTNNRFLLHLGRKF